MLFGFNLRNVWAKMNVCLWQKAIIPALVGMMMGNMDTWGWHHAAKITSGVTCTSSNKKKRAPALIIF